MQIVILRKTTSQKFTIQKTEILLILTSLKILKRVAGTLKKLCFVRGKSPFLCSNLRPNVQKNR